MLRRARFEGGTWWSGGWGNLSWGMTLQILISIGENAQKTVQVYHLIHIAVLWSLFRVYTLYLARQLVNLVQELEG